MAKGKFVEQAETVASTATVVPEKKHKMLHVLPQPTMPLRKWNGKRREVIRGSEITSVPVYEGRTLDFERHQCMVTEDEAEDLKTRSGYGREFILLSDWKVLVKKPGGSSEKSQARAFARELKRRNGIWKDHVFTEDEFDDLFEIIA